MLTVCFAAIEGTRTWPSNKSVARCRRQAPVCWCVSGRSLQLTDDQFYELCQLNRELRIERTAQGALSIMAPAGGDSSALNAEITIQLGVWAKRDGTGRTFDSSGGFVLPNGAVRSPDAAWVSHDRLALPDRGAAEEVPPAVP